MGLTGRSLRTGIAAIMALGLWAIFSSGAQADEGPCDRACLEGITDQYLAALLAHDPSKAPLASDVRFTENGQALQPGEVLWGGITGIREYKIYMTDPAAGQVALFGVVEEHGLPVLYVQRLEVEARRITEIETLAVRSSGLFGPENLKEPRPGLIADVPAKERSSREEMIKAVDLYFDGLEQNTGKIVPFAPDCERIENGVVTSAGTSFAGVDYDTSEGKCKGQFNSGIFTWITHITPRRYMVVDEQRGIVFGIFMFNHRGDVTTANVPGHGEVDLPPSALRPQSVLVAELFKVRNRQLHEIEAVMIGLPYGSRSGWE